MASLPRVRQRRPARPVRLRLLGSVRVLGVRRQQRHLRLLPPPPYRLAQRACETVRLTHPVTEPELWSTHPVAEPELWLTHPGMEPELREQHPAAEPSIAPPKPVEAQEPVPVLPFESAPADW